MTAVALVRYRRRMRRVGNEVIWAVIVSIVCGVVIASFLGGTNVPWILVAAVLGLGVVATVVRRRREERAWHARYPNDDVEERQAPSTAPRQRPDQEAPTPVSTPHGARVLPSHSTDVRRAGARAESLGANPPGAKAPPPEPPR